MLVGSPPPLRPLDGELCSADELDTQVLHGLDRLPVGEVAGDGDRFAGCDAGRFWMQCLTNFVKVAVSEGWQSSIVGRDQTTGVGNRRAPPLGLCCDGVVVRPGPEVRSLIAKPHLQRGP